MTIKTEVEKIAKDTVVIKVEVSPERTAGPINKAYRDVAKKVRIPGFRKGKAPKPIIDQMVGQDVVLEEAAHDIIPAVYPEALESSGVVPVTMPEVDVIQFKEGEPLIFTAKVQVKPEVKLGSLDDLEISEIELPSVDDEIQAELEKLRDKFATLEVADREEAQEGDFVLIDFEGFIEDEPFEGGAGSDYMLELGSGTFIPGFEEQLIGAKIGVDMDVKVGFPEKYQAESLAGKEALFKVKLKEIKTKKLPDMDDEFAAMVSEHDKLQDFKKELEDKISEKQEQQKEAAHKEKALEKLVETSEVDLPDGMVARRVDQMIENLTRQIQEIQGASLEDWLERSGMEPDEFRNNYKQEAVRNLKTELTLEAVVKEYDLEATDEDIEAEIKRLTERSDKDFEELKNEIKERKGYEFLAERLSMDKALDFLKEKAKIETKLEKKDDVDESSADSN